jgi:prevent-host-death family protein
MADRTIPQRELRNNVGAVLREAEAGTSFTITVRGRPMARLVPPHRERRVDVEGETWKGILAMPIDSEQLARDLDEAEAPVDGPDA